MAEWTVRISILCEDSLSRRGLVGEHGLSMLVETPDTRVLLDAGPSGATVENAEKMGVEAIAPCHCTGRRAFAVLQETFEGDVIKVATGDIVEFTGGGQPRLVQHRELVLTSEGRR